jgi:hypothetical protein
VVDSAIKLGCPNRGHLWSNSDNMKVIFRSISVAFAVVLFSALCVAAPQPSALAFFPRLKHGIFARNAVIADLDGDGRPDLAIAKIGHSGRQGSQYRLKVYLSQSGARSRLDIPVRDGMFFLARDIDGDGDLDLIVMGSWPPAPVAVWINDGHGRFSLTDPTAYSNPDENSDIRPAFHCDNLQPGVRDHRFWAGFSENFQIKPQQIDGRCFLPPVDAIDDGTLNTSRTRAPPASSVADS